MTPGGTQIGHQGASLECKGASCQLSVANLADILVDGRVGHSYQTYDLPDHQVAPKSATRGITRV